MPSQECGIWEHIPDPGLGSESVSESVTGPISAHGRESARGAPPAILPAATLRQEAAPADRIWREAGKRPAGSPAPPCDRSWGQGDVLVLAQ